jgi:hypothetical protein
MKKKLYLDDIRIPKDESWKVVKSFEKFVQAIEQEFPDIISFDHDLGKFAMNDYYKNQYNGVDKINYSYINKNGEMTGLDCAKWLIDYCMNKSLSLPKCYVHSANPIGSDNIMGLLNNFLKKVENKEPNVIRTFWELDDEKMQNNLLN